MRAGTALAAPAILRAQSASDELRVAIIGVGGRGSRLLREMVKLPGVKVAVVCDIDPEARDRGATIAEAHKPELVNEYVDLLGRKDIDAFVVATPVDLHREMAVAILGEDFPLYLEKPMAGTAEEVKAVHAAAKASKGLLQIGLQLRYDAARRAAIEAIHAGKIGEIAYMQGNRHTGDLPRDTAWYFDASRSGNSLVEQAVHIIDIMNWAAGSHPLRAMGSGGINVYEGTPAGRTTWDNYVCIFEYPGDVRLTFTHIFIDPRGFTGISEKVWGSTGAIDLPSATLYTLTQRGEPAVEPVKLYDGGRVNFNSRSLEAFFGHVRERSEPLNNADSGRDATLTAIMGRTAIEERRAVEWREVAL